MQKVTIIGGGLAGCEAAWQIARQNFKVELFEMRPTKMTGAHATANLAELICSNSLGSQLNDRPSGVLKNELHRLGSMLMDCAQKSILPAGGALAVDREMFSALVTEKITSHPNITVIREEVTQIPDGPVIIASGPLTSPPLTAAIQSIAGMDYLFFFDAVAPIVTVDSIDMNKAFRGSRYGRGEQNDGDYINCPLDHEQYEQFILALREAKRIDLPEFDKPVEQGVNAGNRSFFEGCLPIEVLAARDLQSLAFGPMRPVGLKNPHTERGASAVLQLRQENLAASLYNLVGFQTNLLFSEQKRIFRMIPGLENAEFVRYGQMHRNTFISSPHLLHPTLQFKQQENLFFAGQLIGVEGYMGNIATGLLAGLNMVQFLRNKPLYEFPPTTMLGSLCRYITQTDPQHFQPMKANFGILPDLDPSIMGKRHRARAFAQRAITSLEVYLCENAVEIS